MNSFLIPRLDIVVREFLRTKMNARRLSLSHRHRFERVSPNDAKPRCHSFKKAHKHEIYQKDDYVFSSNYNDGTNSFGWRRGVFKSYLYDGRSGVKMLRGMLE